MSVRNGGRRAPGEPFPPGFRDEDVRPGLIPPALAVLAALLAGCAQERVCTAIGTPVGVGVTVKAPLASRVADAAVEVCWAGQCRRPRLELMPSTGAAPQTCDGDVCGARATSTADQHGFATVTGLPKSPVRVRLTLRDADGEVVLDRTVQVTPKGRFPNGPHCGEGGPNTMLVAETGVLRET